MITRIKQIINNNTLVFLLIPLFIIQFVYSTQTINPDFSIRGILNFSYLTVLILVLFIIKKQVIPIFANPLFIVSIVLLLLMIFTSIDAINISVAIKSIINYSIFPVFLFVLVSIIHTSSSAKEQVSLLIGYYILILSAISFYQIFNVYSSKTFNLVGIYDIRSSLNHKNLFSHILLLSLPFTIYNIYKQSGQIKYLNIFIVFITLLQIIIVLTRSTWISLTFTFLLVVITYFLLKERIEIVINNKAVLKKASFFIILTITSSFFIFSALDNNNSFSHQVKSLRNLQSQNIQKRVFLWENTIKMIEDNSAFGVGTGNWEINIPKYIKDGKHNNNGEIRYQTPHNDYLSLLSENGVLSLFLYVSILIIGLFYSIRIIRKSVEKDDKVFALLIFGGIISYIIISMFSATKEYSETLFFLSIMLSFVIVGNYKIKDKILYSKALYIFISIFLITISVTGIVYMLKVYKSEMHTKLAVDYINNNNPQLSINEINKAYSVITSCDPTATPLKWYSGNANFVLGKYSIALTEYTEAYNIAPYNSFILTNIAATYFAIEKYKKAEKFFIKSLEIKPNNQQVINNLIITNLQQNNTDKALEICLKQSYENKNNQYYKLFLLTIKQRVDNAINSVEEENIKNNLSNRKDEKYWLWLFKTRRNIFIKQDVFNRFVIKGAITQLAKEWKVSKKEEQLLLKKYRLLEESRTF